MYDEEVLNFNFKNGINEFLDETLLDITEASIAQNVNIDNGTLSTIKGKELVSHDSAVRMAKFFKNNTSKLMPLSNNCDYLNYQIGETEIMLLGDGVNSVRVYDGYSYRNLENRRTVDVESLNIPKNEQDIWNSNGIFCASVKGGNKENSIKVRIYPVIVDSSIYFKRSSASKTYGRSDSIPYDAIPYSSETDILDVYEGEYIQFFEKNTWDGGVKYKKPVVINYVEVKVTNNMITSKIKTPTIFSDRVPKGSMIELNHERVWLAGDVDYPNRVYFSKDFDIDDWTIPIDEGEANQHGGLLDFPTWDGGKIIGLKVLFGDMFVFKEKHIFRIFGTYPGNYTQEHVCTMTGAISDRSIVAGPNAVYFAAKDGIYVFNGNTPTLISQKIKNTWKNLNHDRIKNAVGIFYNNKYFLAVTEGNSSTNNLIIEYNIENNSFIFIRGLEVNDFMEFNGDMLFCNNSGIYNMFQSDSMNINLRAEWITGKMNFGVSNAIKTTQKIYFIGSGNGKVRFSVKNEKGKIKSIELELSENEKFYRKMLKNKGRTLKFSISNVNGSVFNLKDLQITYETDFD